MSVKTCMGGQRIRHRRLGIVFDLGVHGVDIGLARDALLDQPCPEADDRIAVFLPLLLFGLRAVILPVDVADMVAVIAIGLEFDEERPFALARACQQFLGQRVDCQHVLPVDLMRLDAERFGPRGDRAGSDFFGFGVFRIAVVFAGIDHRQLPQGGHVHDLVKQPLRGRPVAKEAHGDIIGFLQFSAQRGAGGDTHGAADNGIRAEVAVALIGDMHRPALAPAVAFLFAQQFAEHLFVIRALGHAVPMAAMGRGDLVLVGQRLADADSDGLLPGIHMCQAGHLGRQIQLVCVVLKGADADHLAIHAQIVLSVRSLLRSAHVFLSLETSRTASGPRGCRDQYRLAMGRSSAGKSEMTSHPVSVTTTSSSIRAAE